MMYENLKLVKLSDASPKKEGYYFVILFNSQKHCAWYSFKDGFVMEDSDVYGWYDESEPSVDAINWDSVWIRYCHDDNAQEDAETFANYLKTKFPNGISFNEPDWDALEKAFYASRELNIPQTYLNEFCESKYIKFKDFAEYKAHLLTQSETK